jgi:DNA-binding transcriptional ArsR family regulator
MRLSGLPRIGPSIESFCGAHPDGCADVLIELAMGDASSAPGHLKAALVGAMGHPLQGRILTLICERPGVTVKWFSRRVDEPPRKVRHQVGRLVEDGLVTIDRESSRRNARELHYRATVRPLFVEEDFSLSEDERRGMAVTVFRIIVDDIRHAIGDRLFGTRPDHAVIRIPGEVDRVGRAELSGILERVRGEIEGVMVESARRLQAGEERGVEVTSALFLFEPPPWPAEEGEEQTPARISVWLDQAGDPAPRAPARTRR